MVKTMIKLYEGAGLKGSWKRRAGATIKWKIVMLVEDIRMAWQRAMYGYSQSDVWDLDHYNKMCEKPTPLGVGWIAQKI